MRYSVICFTVLAATVIQYNNAESTFFEQKKSKDSRILQDTPWTPRGVNQELDPNAHSTTEVVHRDEDEDQ